MNSDTSFGGTLNGRWSLPRSCTDPPRRKIIPTAPLWRRKPDAEHLHIRCRRLDILPVDTHLGASAVGALGVYPCTSAKVPDCYCFLPFFLVESWVAASVHVLLGVHRTWRIRATSLGMLRISQIGSRSAGPWTFAGGAVIGLKVSITIFISSDAGEPSKPFQFPHRRTSGKCVPLLR